MLDPTVCFTVATECCGVRVDPAGDGDKVRHKAWNLTLDQCCITQDDIGVVGLCSVILGHGFMQEKETKECLQVVS